MIRKRTTIVTYAPCVVALRDVAGKIGLDNPKDAEANGSLSELITMLGVMSFRMSTDRMADFLRPLAEEYRRGNAK